MTILYPTPAPVKPRRLGQGILASLPTYPADHTEADEAWLLADNLRREEEDRRLERQYQEGVAIDRLERPLLLKQRKRAGGASTPYRPRKSTNPEPITERGT